MSFDEREAVFDLNDVQVIANVESIGTVRDERLEEGSNVT